MFSLMLRMVSSYEIVSSNIPNRPVSSIFPFGYFVDDYVYTGSVIWMSTMVDLQKHQISHKVSTHIVHGR